MRILVTGASGNLGSYVLDALAPRDHEVIAWSHAAPVVRGDVPLVPVSLEGDDLEARLDEAMPDAVLHLAAISSAEAVRLDPARADLVNVVATARIAAWCRRRSRRLIFSSTDLVFAGDRAANREVDPAEPILAYGRTKRAAESFVLDIPNGLVARVSLLYGFSRSGRDTFFDRTIASLRRGEPQTLFEDEYRTPLDLATAALALIRLTELRATGLIHVAGRDRMSRFDLIRRAAICLGLDPSLVVPNCRTDAPLAEPRPADVSLDTTRLASLLPDLDRPTVEEVVRVFPRGWMIGADG